MARASPCGTHGLSALDREALTPCAHHHVDNVANELNASADVRSDSIANGRSDDRVDNVANERNGTNVGTTLRPGSFTDEQPVSFTHKQSDGFEDYHDREALATWPQQDW